MKIAFVAYKIEKDKGSEDGTAYNILRLLARENLSLTLVTRQNNIDKLKNDPDFSGIRMIAVEVPKMLSFYKKKSRGVILYYYFWQICAGMTLWQIQKSEEFDIIHQFNFHATWAPHFLFSKARIIWGPLTHHENIPYSFWKGNRKGYVIELFRRLIKKAFLYLDPFVKWAIKRSDTIIFGYNNNIGSYTSARRKTVMLPQAGSDIRSGRQMNEKFDILFVGRFMALKGCLPALLAVEKMLLNLTPDKQKLVSFTLVGEGSLLFEMQKIANRITQTTDADIRIIPWISQPELEHYYSRSDIFLLPSFEGQGLVVAEAMAHGCPVLCLEETGPSFLAGDAAITVPKNNMDVTVSVLSQQLEYLFNEYLDNRPRYQQRSERAIKQAHTLGWQNKADKLMEIYHA